MAIILMMSNVKVHLDVSFLDNRLNFSFYSLCDCSNDDSSFREILFSHVVLFAEGTKVRGRERAKIIFAPMTNRR